MSESFFKFNKEISNYFLDYSPEKNIELEDKEYNRYTPYLNIFDVDKNGSLDSNEIKNIWQSIEKECMSLGDELSINEKGAEKIIKEFDKDSKLNGKEFINFFKYLLTRITHQTSSWESQKHFIFNLEGGSLQEYRTGDTVYTYYPSGTLESISDKDGNNNTYYANGKIASEYKKNGLKRSYYLSGKIFEERKEDGSYIQYFENGNIKNKSIGNDSISYYENGNISSKYTGNSYTIYYENGQIQESNEVNGYDFITYYPNGQIKTAIPEDGDMERYDVQGNKIEKPIEKEQKEYDSYYSGQIYETAKELNKLIHTEPIDINVIKNVINKENIVELFKQYHWNEHNIIKDIQNSTKDKVIQQELITYIETTLNDVYSANLKKFPKKTKIENSNWKGAEYKVKWTNAKVYIKNLETNRKSAIDLEKLVKNLPKAERYILLIRLQNLPGEVLEDIAIDANYSNIEMGNAGDYRDWTDTIQLVGGGFGEGTIVHELGHAIDNLFQEDKYSTGLNNELLSSFKEEKMTNPYEDSNKYYAATNIKEFFAECYALLMLGDEYRAKECIEKNFPKSFAIVKEMIKEIRQLQPEVRHRQDLT